MSTAQLQFYSKKQVTTAIRASEGVHRLPCLHQTCSEQSVKTGRAYIEVVLEGGESQSMPHHSQTKLLPLVDGRYPCM